MSPERPAVGTTWKIYKTFVSVGAIAGSIAYGGLSVADGASFATFLVITLPLILVFCLAISLPLAGIALIVFPVLNQRCGPRSARWWQMVGAAFGATLVTAALMCFLSVGALSNQAGRIFWLTFLVAGAVAGARAATVAQRAEAQSVAE